VDGHERVDVVDYRQTKFLPSMLKVEETAQKWSEETIDNEAVIEPGEHRTVVWFHDESTFYVNDHRKT
jgi:hypothetical protein